MCAVIKRALGSESPLQGAGGLFQCSFNHFLRRWVLLLFVFTHPGVSRSTPRFTSPRSIQLALQGWFPPQGPLRPVNCRVLPTMFGSFFGLTTARGVLQSLMDWKDGSEEAVMGPYLFQSGFFPRIEMSLLPFMAIWWTTALIFSPHTIKLMCFYCVFGHLRLLSQIIAVLLFLVFVHVKSSPSSWSCSISSYSYSQVQVTDLIQSMTTSKPSPSCNLHPISNHR